MTLTTEKFLDDSETILQALDRAGIGVWRWPVGSEGLQWTRNLESIHRLPPGAFAGTIEDFARDIHPDDADRVWASIRTAVDNGGSYEVRYRTYPQGDREPAWINARGSALVLDGTKYLTGTCQDVTSAVRSEEELRRRLDHLTGISEFGTYALAEPDFRNILEHAVDMAARIFDVPLTKILQFGDRADQLELKAGRGWKEGLVGHARVGIDRDSQAGYTLDIRQPVLVRDLRTEERFSGPPLLIEHGVISGMSVVIEGTDGRPFGVFGVHDTRPRHFDEVDAGSLRSLANIVANAARNDAALARQTLLTREIEHRAGNLLQIVGVIAKQTFSADADPAGAIGKFQQRLSAISRTNSLISKGGWLPSRLRAVIEEVTLPYRDRVTLTGRDVLLPPELCFDLALVVHELATNSVKYGSLGSNDGTVAVTWSVMHEPEGASVFHLEWVDPKTGLDSRKGSGFGRKLKKLLIESKWNGQLTIEQSDGYRLSCAIPLPEHFPETLSDAAISPLPTSSQG